jgi:hypothetical protein
MCIFKSFVLAVCSVLLLIPSSFDSIRGFLLSNGFNWTWSEWMYYPMLVLTGIALAWSLVYCVRWKSKWKKIPIACSAALIPFIVGFAEHPIYENMLRNFSMEMRPDQALPDYKAVDLVAVFIVDCPYCKRAVYDLNKLQERNPTLRMRVVVCTSKIGSLDAYRATLHESIDVQMATDKKQLATHAGGHFPSFVLVKNDVPVSRWSNNEWGPVAKDIVEREANASQDWPVACSENIRVATP